MKLIKKFFAAMFAVTIGIVFFLQDSAEAKNTYSISCTNSAYGVQLGGEYITHSYVKVQTSDGVYQDAVDWTNHGNYVGRDCLYSGAAKTNGTAVVAGDVARNAINAIIGSSGVGKTTLVDMLPLLLQPSSGKIKIGSIDITEINIKSLRNNFAYVDQSPFFFKGSIMENLTYSQSKINTSKCIEAAKLAKAHSFIIKLPLKYNYLLGETGTGLSGGQLQRLEIAKALATGRKIIILDEPTSNLDSKSSEDILKTIVNINKKTDFTFVIISHKQDISKYCNHLIKL